MKEDKLARVKKPVWITLPDNIDEDPREFDYAFVTDSRKERGTNLEGGTSDYRFLIPLRIEINHPGVVTMVDYSEKGWSVLSEKDLKWANFEDPDAETLRETIEFIFEKLEE